jgi:hypothetical protein
MYLSIRKNHILEVPNWHLKMIFKVVANCDQLDFVFDIADCDVIHPTQNEKAHSF